ncbi:MAG: thiol:disulfide interchange protein DsbA/DsbL [Gammaproteobacteria bacterium]|nr:thiol:disulfide interchange protein DsbA/DsbL [Gammaproteobacteria bacterium]
MATPLNSNVGTLRAMLLAMLLATVTACGQPAGGDKTPAAAAETAPAAAAPAAENPAAPAATTPAADATTGAVTESTTPADTTGEQLKLASAAPATARVWRFQEGQDFKVLTAAQGITGAPDKIEVAEAFWYGCGHCYQFDPRIADYAAKLPGDVQFVRIPVMWNPTNQIHARMYYTAQALGKLEEMHTAIFREMHVNGKTLSKEEEVQAFFGKFGVSAADFQKTFRSFAVEGQLKRARDLTERYQIRSVPQLVVNGKYTTDAPGIKSFDNMFEIVTELIERERAR